MRVMIPPLRQHARRRAGERGAVLILVAVFALVAVIFLAFVVDIGNQRQDRRQLTTATDAAALDVAQSWARESLVALPNFEFISENVWNCRKDAEDYLARNRQELPPGTSCEARFVNEQFASVTVGATDRTTYQVAPAIGLDDGPIAATTSVRVRSTVGGGLRPFAICARDEDVLEWFNDDDRGVEEITLGGDKALPEECGENDGSWGFVVLDSQGSGQKSLADIIRNGSSDPLSSFDNGDEGNADDPYAAEKEVCAVDAEDPGQQSLYDEQDPVTCVFNGTGAAGWTNDNALDAFRYLRDEEITFNVPIYGEIQPIGTGQQTGFPIIGFAEVQIVDFTRARGADQNDMTFRFLNLSTGDCCDVNESNYSFEICDVGTTGGDVSTSFSDNCQTFAGGAGGGAPVPPGSDPCEITDVTPNDQSVNVDAEGALVSDESVTVSVTDATDCEVITVAAVNPTGPAASVAAPMGNDYLATFAAGAVIGVGGSTVRVAAGEGGDVQHDTSTLSTIFVAPCDVVTPIDIAPTPYRQAGKGASYDLLVTPFAIIPSTNGSPECAGMTIKLERLKKTGSVTAPDRTMVQSSFDGVRATYSNVGNDKQWSAGVYRTTVSADGVDYSTEFQLAEVATSP